MEPSLFFFFFLFADSSLRFTPSLVPFLKTKKKMDDDAVLDRLRQMVSRNRDVERELQKCQAELKQTQDTLARYREVCRALSQMGLAEEPEESNKRAKRSHSAMSEVVVVDRTNSRSQDQMSDTVSEKSVEVVAPTPTVKTSHHSIPNTFHELSVFEARESYSSRMAPFQNVYHALVELFEACPGGFVTEQQLIEHMGYHVLTRESMLTSDALRQLITQWPRFPGRRIVARFNPEDSQWIFLIPEWLESKPSA